MILGFLGEGNLHIFVSDFISWVVESAVGSNSGQKSHKSSVRELGLITLRLSDPCCPIPAVRCRHGSPSLLLSFYSQTSSGSCLLSVKNNLTASAILGSCCIPYFAWWALWSDRGTFMCALFLLTSYLRCLSAVNGEIGKNLSSAFMLS